MKKETHIFNLHPLYHQPTGHCDFSKIYDLKNIILICNDINTGKKEQHFIERTDVVNNNCIKSLTYICFFNNKYISYYLIFHMGHQKINFYVMACIKKYI